MIESYGEALISYESCVRYKLLFYIPDFLYFVLGISYSNLALSYYDNCVRYKLLLCNPLWLTLVMSYSSLFLIYYNWIMCTPLGKSSRVKFSN